MSIPLPNRPALIAGIPVFFQQAPLSNWETGHGPYELIVVHDIEGSAASALDTLSNPQRRASTHIINDDVHRRFIQMVDFYATAWTATNDKGNKNGLNIENPGFAGKPFTPLVVEQCAKCVGFWAAYTGIPLVKLDHAQANTPGVKGVCGHGDLTAHPGSDQHTDPGPTWPWDTMLAIAEQTRNAIVKGSPIPPGTFFPETGFGIRGGIRDAFTAAGGVSVFGYPRSWEYDTVENGITVRRQWFERACAEWIPNRPDQPDVTWSLLGTAIIEKWEIVRTWRRDARTRRAFMPGESMHDEPRTTTE